MALDCDLVLGGEPRFEAEAGWARRMALRYARSSSFRTVTETRGRCPLVRDAGGASPLLLVVADAEAYLPPASARRLVSTLGRRPDLDLLLAVSNESAEEETRAAPPFPYVTPSMLERFSEELAATAGDARPISKPSGPVFLARREAVVAFPPDLPLQQLPGSAASRGLAVAADPGAYVHRYGAMDAQKRADLAALLPEGTRAVLDVGCASGGTAAALRERGVAYVAGIEADAEDATAASRVYDRVLAGTLEGVQPTWDREFDAVLFGDVLEHLVDPGEALSRVREWLSPRGVVVASLPNVGHWAVVADLVEGRFDYVPYSLLSGTHVRFFTRSTLCDLFEEAGFAVERIETVTIPASPVEALRRGRLEALPGASPDLDVAEFLIVARRAAR